MKLTVASFSIFHNNVMSLNRYLEDLQTHILEELHFSFNVIGITKTKITNTNVAGYEFEFAPKIPTPLMKHTKHSG